MARPRFGLGLLLAFGAAANVHSQEEEQDLEAIWARFRGEYNRSYLGDDEARRFLAFKASVARARTFNSEQGVACADLFDDEACVFGVNEFADMFEDEFAVTHLGYKPAVERLAAHVLSPEEISAGTGFVFMDWRGYGAVTPVKDQGSCGGGWAFSAAQAIESAAFMSSGKLEQLSTQQIISCDKTDHGCDGGDTVTAYRYVKKAGGLGLASGYPDESRGTGRTGRCKWGEKAAAQVTEMAYATKPCERGLCKRQDEDALATALAAKGPVSICVNAAGQGWQNYKRGIYKRECSAAIESLDHCVQLVGYDRSGTTHYWIVRNSWGASWGEEGYMRLEMGKNLCGLANMATIADASIPSLGEEKLIAV